MRFFVLQEVIVQDQSKLVAIPINTDGFTRSGWIVNNSKDLQNVTHNSTSRDHAKKMASLK